MEFFGDKILLGSPSAEKLYAAVKDLPIIDYHCHLNQKLIAEDAKFADIGEMWLAGDHYKWRAMRMCGVDERLITGGASWKEKFFAYASVLPKLVANPLYYWTHLELKQIFGINEPLNESSAARIYDEANAKLKTLSVRSLLKNFGVEYIATTDDPTADLSYHGVYGGTTVAPTFRPDKLYGLDGAFISSLADASGIKIDKLSDLIAALNNRLDYFEKHGCRISDHGFADFPKTYATEKEAASLFDRRASLSAAEKDAFFGYILTKLAAMYKERGILMQLHFSVIRNVNSGIFTSLGVDQGCDVFKNEVCAESVTAFLDRLGGNRPDIVMYSLNPNATPMLAAITGAFRNVRMGAAWWFNDTALGIRANLCQLAEYACLGTNLGMLTDSRSFSSYSRFDFFRRILCDYMGGLVEKGEYPLDEAERLTADVCYYNIKSQLKL